MKSRGKRRGEFKLTCFDIQAEKLAGTEAELLLFLSVTYRQIDTKTLEVEMPKSACLSSLFSLTDLYRFFSSVLEYTLDHFISF